MLRILFKETKYPLGRWYNCGYYFNDRFLKLKEEQKKKRFEMKKKQIDPYKKILKKNEENDYMLPFIIDW
jgi:hypothetical protein